MIRRSWTSWLRKQGGIRPWIPSCNLSSSVKAIPWEEQERNTHTWRDMCKTTEQKGSIHRQAKVTDSTVGPAFESHLCHLNDGQSCAKYLDSSEFQILPGRMRKISTWSVFLVSFFLNVFYFLEQFWIYRKNEKTVQRVPIYPLSQFLLLISSITSVHLLELKNL